MACDAIGRDVMCDEERLVQIFTELTLNDCCHFEKRSHRFRSSLFYDDTPTLQGWTNTNYMERVAAALRVNIVEFITTVH